MKPETIIFNKVKKIVPENSSKNIFFIGITNTSQEVFFYSDINGKFVQCYTLAEQNLLDENELSEVFDQIVAVLKESKYYDSDKYNVGTIVFSAKEYRFDMEYYDKDKSEYKIQKQWKRKNL